MPSDKKFAVLIDADNISNQYISTILDAVSADGVATYKRIYGDWTKPTLAPWKNVLLNHSITPIQQYSYTTGKNATDSAMIIDAMDILYTHSVDGFCIASSDSDFTRLAARLREAGMYVIGMGEKKTPAPFIAACDKFKFLEILASPEPDVAEAPPVLKNDLNELTKQILAIVSDISDEDGWIYLADIGSQLQRRNPDFDVRNYGFTKMRALIEKLGVFETRVDQSAGNKSSLIYVRKRAEAPTVSDVPRKKQRK